MSNHKFTDEQIIHSLEVCSSNGDCKECDINPNRGNFGYCTSLALKAALDLINRQKAEIGKWKKNCDELYEQMSDRQKAEVEIARRMGKAEAIKEFAERLHKGINDFREKREMVMLPYTEAALLCIEKKIDNLVKEMTEGNT